MKKTFPIFRAWRIVNGHKLWFKAYDGNENVLGELPIIYYIIFHCHGKSKFSLKVFDSTFLKIKGIVCGFPLKAVDSVLKITQGILLRFCRNWNHPEAVFFGLFWHERILLCGFYINGRFLHYYKCKESFPCHLAWPLMRFNSQRNNLYQPCCENAV